MRSYIAGGKFSDRVTQGYFLKNILKYPETWATKVLSEVSQ